MDHIGFTLPSLFADSSNICKQEEKKKLLKNTDSIKNLSTQRSEVKLVQK